MRRLPKKREILQKARELDLERAAIHGLPTITPTEAELKESGAYHEARVGLMRSPQTAIMLEQRRYLDQMATEMRLTIIPKREHREQLRKVQAFDVFKAKHPSRVVKVNGYKITIPTIPKPKVEPLRRVSLRKPLDMGSAIRGAPKPKKRRKPRPIVPKVKAKPKKKRRKNHTQRSGKTMRKLRKVKGVKVFSFPDHIWKVRK